MTSLALYPDQPLARDQWVLDRRPQRNVLDPLRPHAYLHEVEPSATGELLATSTLLLTNRECPWRCVMCDLWKNTLPVPTPTGAIPEQIRFALAHLPPARQVKLYNSGSFFDRLAIPPFDYPHIAGAVQHFDRVIVESHPALIGDLTLQLRDLLQPQLEVAMGLETVHPEALRKINKKISADQFAAAAVHLREARVDLRVFLLVQPPFVPAEESLAWVQRSLHFAFDCGATAVTLIPTRGGNGAMEELALSGDFRRSSLSTVEQAFAFGLALARGRVFVDLWDIALLPCCPACRDARIERLQQANLTQRLAAPVACGCCEGDPS